MRIGIDASRAFVKEKTGTENYSFQMIRHLLELPEAKKHQWVLYVKNIENIKYQNFQPNVKIVQINLTYLWTQLGLAARTWADSLDILWVPAHTLPVLRKPGVRTVVTIHGIEYEYLPSFQNPLQRWYLPLSTQYAAHSAQKLIAVSEFTRKQLIERLGADPNKITVIHEGVGEQRLVTSSQSLEVLRKFGLDARRYFLFIGTVQPRKNLARLILAYTDIQNEQIDLLVIGKLGWGYSDLPIGQNPRIKFLGFQDDETRDILLSNALAYVQPSITEGFGLPILEAFAAGVPVISSNGGALKEVVGEAGLLFDPTNIVEMTETLRQIIEDAKLRKALIIKGKRRLQDFSWQKAALETYNILV